MATSRSDHFWSIFRCLLLMLADMLTCHVAPKLSLRVASSWKTLYITSGLSRTVDDWDVVIENKMILNPNRYTADCYFTNSGEYRHVSRFKSGAGRCVALDRCPESCLIHCQPKESHPTENQVAQAGQLRRVIAVKDVLKLTALIPNGPYIKIHSVAQFFNQTVPLLSSDPCKLK